eukprot:UN13923
MLIRRIVNLTFQCRRIVNLTFSDTKRGIQQLITHHFARNLRVVLHQPPR